MSTQGWIGKEGRGKSACVTRGGIKYINLTWRSDEMEFNNLAHRGIKVQEFPKIGKVFSTLQTLIFPEFPYHF